MSTSRGRLAEDLASQYLQTQGLRVVERNWRSRFHEIDIVAQGPTGWHFVEVKYRARSDSGGGFDSVNSEKQHRLARVDLRRRQDRAEVGLLLLFRAEALRERGSRRVEREAAGDEAGKQRPQPRAEA